MGGVNVKNTMIERLLAVVAPHPCSGCPKIGAVLCTNCKYDIIHEPFHGCILCAKPQISGICPSHHSPITRAFIVSCRAGALEDAINRLKFKNTKQSAHILAALMDEALPCMPKDILVVPVPTVTSHIRQRGYDHVELIVRQFAQSRKLPINRLLVRQSTTTQHTVDRLQRLQQAVNAFSLSPTASIKGVTVLLIDDIITTGSTVQAAADLLKNAGAIVWVAALAYQPLD